MVFNSLEVLVELQDNTYMRLVPNCIAFTLSYSPNNICMGEKLRFTTYLATLCAFYISDGRSAGHTFMTQYIESMAGKGLSPLKISRYTV